MLLQQKKRQNKHHRQQLIVGHYIMGGSILPVAVHQKKVYFLFGKERDIDENPGWSDFGGGTDKGETLMQTAVREGMEETTGFLGNQADILKMLKQRGTYIIDHQSPGFSVYRCHLFPMKYDESLVTYYNNNQRFLQKRLPKNIIRDTKIFEKTQLKWFSFDELATHKKSFRKFYRNIIQHILDQQREIEAFARKSNNHKSRKIKTKINTTRKRH